MIFVYLKMRWIWLEKEIETKENVDKVMDVIIYVIYIKKIKTEREKKYGEKEMEEKVDE